ncbi:cutinase transcription factor 1 beta [Fusarium flagelliforme]|uniref:Cutinase transcription factor 1 beta n=1 Tax=Fusarium flagelliforme TaxID=2675880 RepID=A0A395MGP1_9HYPO|nr:cutinase transcription factor 1 beta [Fusarium flagelliforme]
MTENVEAKPRQRRQDARKRSPRDRIKPRVSSTKTVIEPLPSPKEDQELPIFLTVNTSETLNPVQVSPRHDHQPEITFAYYPFLCITNLSSLPAEDVKYLESQGCFKVPESTLLDDLVRAYFRYAHPILPVVNEAEFWSIYDYGGKPGRISIILLSAMLFVACKYVDHNVILGLQLDSAYEARKRLLRKTQLLYDQETESSPLVLSQVSLLLAQWPLQKTSRTKGQWLGRAFSHCQDAIAEARVLAMPTARLNQSNLRRLVGCCILSDCVHSLYTRRPLMMPSGIAEDHSVLSRVDLSHEIGRSRVYSVEAKQQLIEAHEQMSSLVTTLRRVLALVYPQKGTCTSSTISGDEQEIRECKEQLRSWYNDSLVLSTSRQDSAFGDSPASSNDEREHEGSQHQPMELLVSIMYIHYDTAMLSLCQSEILGLTTSSRLAASPYKIHERPSIREKKYDLSNCIINLTDRLSDSLQQQLLPQVPESMILCTALPLLLFLLHTKQSAQSVVGAHVPRCPDWVRKVMACLRLHYRDELEYILQAVKAVNHNLTQILQEDVLPPGEEPLQIINWRELLDTRPRLYARLVENLDNIISWGGPLPETDMAASFNEKQTPSSTSLTRQVRAKKILHAPSQRRIDLRSPPMSDGYEPATTAASDFQDAWHEHFGNIIQSCLAEASEEIYSQASLDLWAGEIAPSERSVLEEVSPRQGIESAATGSTDGEDLDLGNGLSDDWIDALLKEDVSLHGDTASQTAEDVDMDAARATLSG